MDILSQGHITIPSPACIGHFNICAANVLVLDGCLNDQRVETPRAMKDGLGVAAIRTTQIPRLSSLM